MGCGCAERRKRLRELKQRVSDGIKTKTKDISEKAKALLQGKPPKQPTS